MTDSKDSTPFVLGDLPAVAAYISESLKASGFTEKPHLWQALVLAEEAGEFVGAVRRYYGAARRAGSLDDVRMEAADVVLAMFVAACEIGFDLTEAINEKLGAIYSRGWRDQ